MSEMLHGGVQQLEPRRQLRPSSAAKTVSPKSATEAAAPEIHSGGGSGSRLWWWIVAILAVQLAVWTGWFILAARHPVDEVPLATAGEGR
jgi:hypothetical protein